MSIFSRPETVVLKEGCSSRQQLDTLEALRGTLPAAAEKRLEDDIRNLKAGIAGEDRVLYELKNSHMDMFVLQDLFLEHNGLTAQIDFLVITPQRNFVLECKNLYGNIEVNARGDFIRHLGRGKKEGVYSPIAQNRRHIDLIHAMRRDSRGAVMNLLVDRNFDDMYRSLVVLANPKTVLNDRYAKREVKQCLVRADLLVDAIKAINNEKGVGKEKGFKSDRRELAEWFLSRHKDCPVDYVAWYREGHENDDAASGAEIVADSAVALSCDVAVMPAPGVICPPGVEGATTTPGQEPIARCPICGSTMVLRTAKRGARAGKQFFGCSMYPVCHGIVNLEE